MRRRETRIACALALALCVPAARADMIDAMADGWAAAQAGVSRVLGVFEPAEKEKAPVEPAAVKLDDRTEDAVVGKLAAGATPGGTPPQRMTCSQGVPEGPVDLAAVVGQALCNHPKTRAAYAQARAEAARVDVARAAWQPSAQADAAVTDARYNYTQPVTQTLSARTFNLKLQLSWLLYDFGRRQANFDSAVAVLDAANATQNATVQQVLMEATQAWFEARAAEAKVDATREAERSAGESLEVAKARYAAGAAARLDTLQAANSYAQSRLKLTEAESGLRTALGALAVKMGLPAETALTLAPAADDDGQWSPPGSPASLIAEARLYHPRLRAARAKAEAVGSQIGIARAEGLPSVAGTASYLRNKELESTPLSSYDSNRTVGVQFSMPLFEGQARQGRIAAAQAEYEARRAEVADMEQQVGLEVWQAWNELKSARNRLSVGNELLDNARHTQAIAQGRYKEGVGDILESLNAQSVLAQAAQQQIEARAAWQIARLKLAAAMGRIGPWAVE